MTDRKKPKQDQAPAHPKPGPLSIPTFDEGDIDLLSHAVSLTPDLELATYGAKLARELLNFPLENVEALSPLFDGPGETGELRGRILRFADVAKFLSPKLFPITDPVDFIGKVLLGLSWGAVVHHHEEIIERAQNGQAFDPGHSPQNTATRWL